VSIEWHDEGMSASLERLLADLEDVSQDAAAGARVILDESNTLVPKVSGDLASTGRVDQGRGGADTATILYLSVYAHWIHEHLFFKHPHGGQAKFLETAMLSKGEDAINRAGEHFFGRI
jgi:hypothetical protein